MESGKTSKSARAGKPAARDANFSRCSTEVNPPGGPRFTVQFAARRNAVHRPRRTAWTAFALLLCLAACGAPHHDASSGGTGGRRLAGAAEGWNVLLLSADTVRADRLGAYGYRARKTSPRIDALLSSGVRFEHASAQRALTWPSLTSVLTGLYPSVHGVLENGYRLADDVVTLPEILHRRGYTTAAFLSNMCQATHRGWDAFACSGGQDGKTVARALDWAAGPAGDRPWFLWVHLFGAHGPYYNGGDLAETTFDPGYEGPVGTKKWQLDRIMLDDVHLDERDLHHLDAVYDAAVLGTDHSVGRLLDGLAERRGLDHTLIVLLSDHGEELYQHHGYLYHACSVYQTTLHVPLGFVAPSLLPAGSTVQQRVELIDVTPTLLDLLGMPEPPGIEGVSLVPYLERPGAGGEGRPAFSEYGSTRIHTVASGHWKLISNPDEARPACMEGWAADRYPIGRQELYDLSADPGETVDLAEREPATVAALEKLIRQRFAGLARRDREQQIPEETKEKLRALGYVAP